MSAEPGGQGADNLQEPERDFVQSIQAAQQIDKMPYVNWTLYMMVAFLVTLVTWASIARVDVVTRAEGRIVPDGPEQMIASLEGGILREISVREGTEVSAGQVVARLDPTRSEALQNEGRVKRLALLGSLARLRAEVDNADLKFPPEVLASAAIVNGETEAFNARLQALQDADRASESSLRLLQTEFKTAQKMARSGLLPEIEVMRLQHQINDLEQSRAERTNQAREQSSNALVRVNTELAQLDEQLIVRSDALDRTVLRSPVRGLVKNIRVATVGGVVGAGTPIMEIVPLGGRVLIEARIKPSDIGFIREGLPAQVKLTAYEYNTYGGLKGTVEYISPDALGNSDRGGDTDPGYYRARIGADVSTLIYRGKPLAVRPGMTASIEISTSERTVLSYLMRPVLRGSEAFRE